MSHWRLWPRFIAARLLRALPKKWSKRLAALVRLKKENIGRYVERVGQVDIDLRACARAVQKDLVDDWFPDPLNFRDLLAPDSLAKVIAENKKRNGGTYVPAQRALFDIPKPGFTLRYALETVVADRVIYHGLVSSLIPVFDKFLPWNAFGHRYDYGRRRGWGKQTFKPSVESWKHFVGCARAALNPGSYLVTADVSNFYEHVQLPKLRDELHALCDRLEIGHERESARAHINTLFHMLTSWAFEEHRGLPQNRDASSFLANIYLRPVDEAMRLAGYQTRYFRYMDDIRIICSDHFEARLAIKTLTLALRDMGLSLNAKKTGIVSEADKETVDESLVHTPEMLNRIDILWRKRNRDAFFRAWPLLKQRTLELAQQDLFDSREFKYCMRRVGNLALYKNLHFPASYYSDITTEICKAIPRHPALTDQYCEYLMSVEVTEEQLLPVIQYLRTQSQSIYPWQNYRLWLVLVAHKIESEDLRQIALSAVSSGDDPSRAGASLYLGSLESKSDLRSVIQRFHELSTFIGQRAALIAMHEVPYGEIREHVINVRPELLGVYRRLRRAQYSGTYSEPREKVTIELGESHEFTYE